MTFKELFNHHVFNYPCSAYTNQKETVVTKVIDLLPHKRSTFIGLQSNEFKMFYKKKQDLHMKIGNILSYKKKEIKYDKYTDIYINHWFENQAYELEIHYNILLSDDEYSGNEFTIESENDNNNNNNAMLNDMLDDIEMGNINQKFIVSDIENKSSDYNSEINNQLYYADAFAFIEPKMLNINKQGIPYVDVELAYEYSIYKCMIAIYKALERLNIIPCLIRMIYSWVYDQVIFRDYRVEYGMCEIYRNDRYLKVDEWEFVSNVNNNIDYINSDNYNNDNINNNNMICRLKNLSPMIKIMCFLGI